MSSRMINVNRLAIEEYHCVDCDKEFSSSDVENTWRCPDCDELIKVCAEDPESGTAITLQRVKAEELEEYDIIHLPGQLTGESYQILGIRKKGIKLNLRRGRTKLTH